MQKPTPAALEKPSATYQQLQLIMAQSGCPICHLGQQAGHTYLDSLLWESVNDPGIRDTLMDSLGFCGRHTRELLTFSGERVGVAILQRAILEEVGRRLQQSTTSTSPSLFQRLQEGWLTALEAPKTAGPLTPTHPCPACVQQGIVEERALQVLVAHLQDDLAAPLQAAGGLCVSHLGAALQLASAPEALDTLRNLHHQVWAQVIEYLSEFIRKNDHRFHAEKLTEDERISVERSMTILTGAIITS
jgi:hypothetical protein